MENHVKFQLRIQKNLVLDKELAWKILFQMDKKFTNAHVILVSKVKIVVF